MVLDIPTMAASMVLRFAFRSICVVFATGCASPHSEIHLGPLYSSHSVPGFSRTETAAGLIRKERFENATTWAVNPLFWRRTLDSGHQVTDFLYPLGRSTFDPDRPQTSTRLLPFLWYDREMKANGIEEVDWFVFPFVGGSASDGSESSFGVFPFYGDLRGFMSWDRLEWILFPFWVRTSQSGRQHTNFLWPVFGKRSGAGSSGWHAFPFYGTNSLEGKYERRYILWPFWTEAKEKLWQSTPQKGWQLWPFFGTVSQDDFKAHTVLWPFIAWAHRPSTEYSSWSILPFLRFEDAPQDGRHFSMIWPLFLSFQNEKSTWRCFFWPLFWHRLAQSLDAQKETWSFLPFWQKTTTSFHNGQSHTMSHAWPLLRVQKASDGRRDVRFPSPGLSPILDPDALSNNLGPAFEIWTDRSGPEEAWNEQRVIGNLYHAAQGDGHSRWSIPLLGGIWKEPNGTEHVSLLGGLIRWKSNEQGTSWELPAFPGPGWPALDE